MPESSVMVDGFSRYTVPRTSRRQLHDESMQQSPMSLVHHLRIYKEAQTKGLLGPKAPIVSYTLTYWS